MGNYATIPDVQARLPGRKITGSSSPTKREVDGWVRETEAEVEGELAAAGFAVPVNDERGRRVLRSKVTSKVAARWLEAVSGATDAESRDLAGKLLEEWTAFLLLVRQDPARVAVMIGQSWGSGGGKRLLRSYVTDNRDRRSAATGDFDPTFRRDLPW